MSRVLAIARADLRHALRDRLVWGAVVLLGAMFLPSTATVAAAGHRTIGEFLLLVPHDLLTYVLVVVAAVGFGAVVGERSKGTLRFLLGLPATRRDVVLDKLLSRAAVVVLALGVVLGIANALVYRGYGDPHLVPFWTMAAWMVAYGVVWCAVTVGYSAAFASQYRTLAALAGTFAVFSPDVGLWSVVVRPLFALGVTGSLSPPTYEVLARAPLWLQITDRLNPLLGFWAAMRWSVATVGPGTPVGGPVPHLFGTAVFLAFGAVPFAWGRRRFERADLGGAGPTVGVGDRLWRHLPAVTVPLTDRVGWPATLRVRAVAAADLRHALQNWVVVGAAVLTGLLVVPGLWEGVDASGIATAREVVADVPGHFGLALLVLAVGVGYQAVAGERDAGTARFVLGLPVTRRELVHGTLWSRVVIVVATLAPLLVLAGTLVATRLGGTHVAGLLAGTASIGLYAVVWTGVAVGISAGSTSRYRALAALFGTYLVFGRSVGLWDPVVRPALGLLATGRFAVPDAIHAADPARMWVVYADHCNPLVALETVGDALYAAAGYQTGHVTASLELVAFSAAVSLSFPLVALVLGSRRFDRRDL